jgi:hypothetical protein
LNPIILTALLGFVGGCAAVVFSKLIIDPYLEYRSVLKDISHTLIFHAGLIMSQRFPKRTERIAEAGDIILGSEYTKAREEHMSVSRKVRDLSARLRACVTPLLRFFRVLPSEKDLSEAAGCLIRISNCMLEHEKKFDLIYMDVKKVGLLLKIDVATG